MDARDMLQPLPGLGPEVGQRYRNRHTDAIAVVLNTSQRRHGWVTLRIYGSEQTIKISKLEEHFELITSLAREEPRAR